MRNVSEKQFHQNASLGSGFAQLATLQTIGFVKPALGALMLKLHMVICNTFYSFSSFKDICPW